MSWLVDPYKCVFLKLVDRGHDLPKSEYWMLMRCRVVTHTRTPRGPVSFEVSRRHSHLDPPRTRVDYGRTDTKTRVPVDDSDLWVDSLRSP